jgi:purine-nucleoside phosphorylase
MENYRLKIDECAETIKGKIKEAPKVAFVLGTGLGKLVDEMSDKLVFPYANLPYFPKSTVVVHAGQLVFGKLKGKDMVMLQGRFHFYEGYSMKEVVFPIYVLKALGVETLILTNACGGVNEDYEPGDIVLINDFINMVWINPLIGINDEKLGPRFPDMSEPYSFELIRKVKALDPSLHEGIYAHFSGPYYETKAEIRAAKVMGADLVGMSTVPETIAANHCGLKVLAFAVVTNMATGIQKVKHDHHRVVEMANQAAIKLETILLQLIEVL